MRGRGGNIQTLRSVTFMLLLLVKSCMPFVLISPGCILSGTYDSPANLTQLRYFLVELTALSFPSAQWG